jgi:hypothetical protein
MQASLFLRFWYVFSTWSPTLPCASSAESSQNNDPLLSLLLCSSDPCVPLTQSERCRAPRKNKGNSALGYIGRNCTDHLDLCIKGPLEGVLAIGHSSEMVHGMSDRTKGIPGWKDCQINTNLFYGTPLQRNNNIVFF